MAHVDSVPTGPFGGYYKECRHWPSGVVRGALRGVSINGPDKCQLEASSLLSLLLFDETQQVGVTFRRHRLK